MPADRDLVITAARAVASCLEGKTYAVVGGAALALLGSSRTTLDVDVVVPRGMTADARKALREAPEHFTVEPRTLHTRFKSEPAVAIEILTPPLLFRDKFDGDTPTVEVEGVRVLAPVRLLNAKCGAILGRWSDERKEADAFDILYLLKYLLSDRTGLSQADVPYATPDFVQWFCERYGGEDLIQQLLRLKTSPAAPRDPNTGQSSADGHS